MVAGMISFVFARRRLTSTVAALALGFGLAQLAAADPPSRVARLNYVQGFVSFRPGWVEEWAPATVNYPLTIGGDLWVDQGARAELHIGSTAIRLTPGGPGGDGQAREGAAAGSRSRASPNA